MSNLTIRFYSNCLRRYTTFKMYLPCDIRQDWGQTDTKYSENSTKTLFLLHGFTGDAENWVPEYLADKYNFAVVIPSGENSFWLDGRSTGHQFCKFVVHHLMLLLLVYTITLLFHLDFVIYLLILLLVYLVLCYLQQ